MLNKRRGMSPLETAVLLVGFLVVLAVVVAGFSLQWGNFATWIRTDNVETIKTKCINACNAQSELDYCLSPVNFKTSAYRISTSGLIDETEAAEKVFLDSLQSGSLTYAEEDYRKMYDHYKLVLAAEKEYLAATGEGTISDANKYLIEHAKAYLRSYENDKGEQLYSENEKVRFVDTIEEAVEVLGQTKSAPTVIATNGKINAEDDGNGVIGYISSKILTINARALKALEEYNTRIKGFNDQFSSIDPKVKLHTTQTIKIEDFESIMEAYLKFQEYKAIKEGYMPKKLYGFINIKTGTAVVDYSCRQLTEHLIWGKVFEEAYCAAAIDFCDEEGSELKGGLVDRANPALWGDTTA